MLPLGVRFYDLAPLPLFDPIYLFFLFLESTEDFQVQQVYMFHHMSYYF